MRNVKDRVFIIPAILLTILIFIVGLFIPLGIAAAVPYVFVVLLTLWISGSNYTYITGAVTTILTLAGIFFAPSPITDWSVVITNRAISVIGIWICVLVVLRQKNLEKITIKSKDQLEQMNMLLEHKVAERTNSLTVAFKELEQSRAELETALNKEKELNEMKTRFITTASHEFRTPLAAVLLSIGLIEQYAKAGSPEKVFKHVARIRSSVKDLETILEDFLSLEKFETGKIKLTKRNFNLREFCEDTMEDVRAFLKKGQHIQYTHTGGTEIKADKKILQHILLNLLSNACKYSGEDKQIQLETDVCEERVCIKVSDNGIGIPAEEQKNMFTKFFRAQNAGNVQGTGIGLNIVKQYVDLVNGNITFRSVENNGTTFTVELPLN